MNVKYRWCNALSCTVDTVQITYIQIPTDKNKHPFRRLLYGQQLFVICSWHETTSPDTWSSIPTEVNGIRQNRFLRWGWWNTYLKHFLLSAPSWLWSSSNAALFCWLPNWISSVTSQTSTFKHCAKYAAAMGA